MKDFLVKLLALFNLTPQDVWKVVLQVLMVMASAGLTYLTTWVTKHDFGQYTWLIVTVWAGLLKVGQKSADTPVNDAVGKNVL